MCPVPAVTSLSMILPDGCDEEDYGLAARDEEALGSGGTAVHAAV